MRLPVAQGKPESEFLRWGVSVSKIKYALGMLATGAMAGMATHAAASGVGAGGPPVFTFTPDPADVIVDGTQPFSYDVALPGFLGAPQTIFTYHGDGQTNHLTGASKSLFTNATTFNSQVFNNSNLPSPTETFDQTDITTWTNTATPDPWYHVEFQVFEGFSGLGGPGIPGLPGGPIVETFLGTVQINANGNQELDQMLYTPLSVPEPETWALMILGLGATGAALRQRSRALAA